MSAPKKSKPSAELVEFPWHREARLVLDIGEPPLVLLAGEPGVGKSAFARRESIARTGREPVVLSGSPEVELSHIFGRLTLAGQETRFVDGPLPTALKTGLWLVVEEFSQIPPETRASFMPLRDQSRITNPLTGEVIEVPPAFRLIATSNSESLTCRKNTGLARVLYDGFMVLETPALSDSQVRGMLEFHFPEVGERRLARALELWHEYRDFSSKGSTGKSFLSVRAAMHFVRLLEAGLSEDRAVQIAFVNKFLTGDADLFEAAKLKASLGGEPGATTGHDDF